MERKKKRTDFRKNVTQKRSHSNQNYTQSQITLIKNTNSQNRIKLQPNQMRKRFIFIRNRMCWMYDNHHHHLKTNGKQEMAKRWQDKQKAFQWWIVCVCSSLDTLYLELGSQFQIQQRRLSSVETQFLFDNIFFGFLLKILFAVRICWPNGKQVSFYACIRWNRCTSCATVIKFSVLRFTNSMQHSHYKYKHTHERNRITKIAMNEFASLKGCWVCLIFEFCRMRNEKKN